MRFSEISADDMIDQFVAYDRDKYSIPAYNALYEYYSEFPDTELDVVGICCEWNEYTNETPEDLIHDYGYFIYDDQLDDPDDPDERFSAIIEEISQKTTVLNPVYGIYLVQVF